MNQGPMLQCPDCGARHDLGGLGDAETFRCDGCSRALKVPLQIREARARGGDPTQVMAVTARSRSQAAANELDARGTAEGATGQAGAAQGSVRRASWLSFGSTTSPVSVWLRLAIWCIAVPAGLLIVFGGARSMGWVTMDQLIKTFTGQGWDRFAPIARLLPFAALLSATMVQASVAGLERRIKRTVGSDGVSGASDARRSARLEDMHAR